MKKQFPAFLSGVMVTVLVLSLSLGALAASGKLTLEVDPVAIRVGGEMFQPKDEKGKDVPLFAYNGTTYAPVRALAEAYGLYVGYDKTAGIVWVNDVPEAAVPAADAVRKNKVNVSTAAELVAAIAPNTEIILAPGEYNLTPLANKTNNPYVVWTEEFDGPQLNILNVEGLTLRGQNMAKTNILVTPRYADVLHFEGCTDVVLDALTIGHTPTGSCEGSVLNFSSSAGILVTGSDLYGCGTYGIEALYASNLLVEKSNIRDCSYGAAIIQGSQNVTIDQCQVYGNDAFDLFNLYGSSNVAITSSVIRDTADVDTGYWSLLTVEGASGILVKNCEFKNNAHATFSDVAPGGAELTVEGCTFEGNGFEAPTK